MRKAIAAFSADHIESQCLNKMSTKRASGQMRSSRLFVDDESVLDADAMTRCHLAYEDDEGAGEPVDSDFVVPTVGAN
jgi:hypothetical protein